MHNKLCASRENKITSNLKRKEWIIKDTPSMQRPPTVSLNTARMEKLYICRSPSFSPTNNFLE